MADEETAAVAEKSFGDQQREASEERVKELTTEERVEEIMSRGMDLEEDTPDDDAPVDEIPEDEAEDELDEVDTEPKVEGEDDLVEFEWEGNLIAAPASIKEALMRNSDYTQKTQEVAASRKELEVQRGEVKMRSEQFQFAQSIQPDVLKAQQLEQQAEQAHQYLRDNIDSLSSTDIEKIRLAVDDAHRERDQLVQSVTQKQTEFQQAQEQSHEELLTKGTEVLRSRIPGWGEKSQSQVREYALNSGYTEQEISGVVDPRQVETLWKASQYDALQAGKVAAVQKVQGAPTIKPKSRNPMPEDVKAKLNLRKQLKNPKLSDRDKADRIRDALGDRFG